MNQLWRSEENELITPPRDMGDQFEDAEIIG